MREFPKRLKVLLAVLRFSIIRKVSMAVLTLRHEIEWAGNTTVCILKIFQ